VVRTIEPLAHAAEQARGEQRQRIAEALAAADRRMITAVDARLSDEVRAALTIEASRELEPFRARMSEAVYRDACAAARTRLIRQQYGLPEIAI
jgi:hypothetical protein